MMNFVDGPAACTVLRMRRTPLLLRVVRNKLVRNDENVWDCLNELEDVARPHEEIFVYILVDKPSPVLSMRPRSGSGWYWIGSYRFLEQQPAEEILRDNAKWSAWCNARREQLMPEWAKRRGGVA